MIAQETLHQMPLREKLFVMETLWEEISAHGSEMRVPQWHQELLDERENSVASGEASFMDWEEAKQKIFNAIQ